MSIFDDARELMKQSVQKPATPVAPTPSPLGNEAAEGKNLFSDYGDDFRKFAEEQTGSRERPAPPVPNLGRKPFEETHKITEAKREAAAKAAEEQNEGT